jgi:tripartite-type tricarboxylate transporter receptor subunit TctC
MERFTQRFTEGVMQQLARRRFLQVGGAVIAAPGIVRPAAALDYPARPVRIVVGFPPGGPTDIFARLMGQWLSDRLGQPFVVENRPGAGSTIGVEAVVSSPADGYTLLLISTSAVISASYYKNLNFDVIRDIAPVCGIALEPLVMVVNPAVPANSVPEFIGYAKANPGKVTMASVGNGTTPHLAGELFKMMAGVNLLHIPYHGAAPALTDLLGGRADVMFEAMPTLVGYIRAGKLRALAVTPAKRSPVFPDIPTVGEFLPGYEASVWFGLAARKQTPVAIIERLNKEINAGLNDPALKARLGDVGGTALTGSSAEFEKLFVADTQKWAKVIKAADIKQE